MEHTTLETVTENAVYKFWESVASELPEIKSGDLDPMTDYRFTEMCMMVIKEWVETNRKEN